MNAPNEGLPAFTYGRLAVDTLKGPRAFHMFEVQPVDVEVIPDFGGAPDRMEAWLIFETREQGTRAELEFEAWRGEAVSLLSDAGFPREAIPSFVLRFTSIPEIEARGGRCAFFR